LDRCSCLLFMLVPYTEDADVTTDGTKPVL